MTDGGTGSVADEGPLQPEEGRELGELLAALGVDERPAHIVGFLAAHGSGRSADIEESLGMRQPEVSQATKHLRDKEWVVATQEKTPGKGRPVNIYTLQVDLGDIVGEIEARRREEINRKLAQLDRLRALASQTAPSEPEVPAEAEEAPSPGGPPEARKG